LIVLWEAADRICGRRLKALLPQLVEAIERHQHIHLEPDVRAQLLAMSAATIDRQLCYTSRIALVLAKQRLMSSVFEYYQLARPDEGISSGFDYKVAKHTTSSTIANNEPPLTEPLYDEPRRNTEKARVSGPFTVEAVPAPTVRSLDEVDEQAGITQNADNSVARSGATLRPTGSERRQTCPRPEPDECKTTEGSRSVAGRVSTGSRQLSRGKS
jgi:hypothetical protein